jgi:hypothetical protein
MLPMKQAVSKPAKQNLLGKGVGLPSLPCRTGTQVWKDILRTEVKEKSENKK